MTLQTFVALVSGAALFWTAAFAVESERADPPGLNPILDQALKGEAGVQVYVDKEGNIGTVIDAGPGHRSFILQPPPSPSLNFGPPLQLHNKSLSLPINPPSAATGDASPASPPAR